MEVDQSVTFITSLINISRELSIVTALFLVMVYFEPLLAVYVFLLITLFVVIFLYSTDKKLKEIAKKDGIFMVTFSSQWVTFLGE